MSTSKRSKLGTVAATNLGLWPPATPSQVKLWTVWSDGTATAPVDDGASFAGAEVVAKRVSGQWRVKYSSAKNGIDSYVTIDSDNIERFFLQAISSFIYSMIDGSEDEDDDKGINSKDNSE